MGRQGRTGLAARLPHVFVERRTARERVRALFAGLVKWAIRVDDSLDDALGRGRGSNGDIFILAQGLEG